MDTDTEASSKQIVLRGDSISIPFSKLVTEQEKSRNNKSIIYDFEKAIY